MYIPQDIVNLIIDQMVLVKTVEPHFTLSERYRWLQATSLVSTAWVNPSQRQLFSTVDFYCRVSLEKWCSRIRSGPDGISSHVRVLRLWAPSLSSDIIKFALPHLTSFRNLRELGIGQVLSGERSECIDINPVFLDILVPISSFAGTLKRLQWAHQGSAHETWKTLYALTDLLPNLTDIDLSCIDNSFLISPPTHPRIFLSSDCQPPDPFAFTHFKFQELGVGDSVPPSPQFLEYCKTHLRVLNLWNYDSQTYRQYHSMKQELTLTTALTVGLENLGVLFEACYALQEFSFCFESHIGSILGLIPSDSVTLIRIRIHDPVCIIGTTYNSCWGRTFEDWLDLVESRDIPEYEALGVSIRQFSEHNCGSKTRVQVVYEPSEEESQAIGDGEIPFFMTKLEEELGTHVILELDLLPVAEPWQVRTQILQDRTYRN